ncbi:MAG: cobalamin-dependent protein [Pseudomonadota bacterium]
MGVKLIMRALLVNAKAGFSFWTLPKTGILSGSKTLAPPLGIITVAAMLPSRWELKFVDLNTRRLTDADWNWADMVMVSAMLAQRDSMLAVVGEAKRRGKPVVVGGPYPTSVPDELSAAGADFLVLGEGECSIPPFLNALEQGATHGVFRCDEKADMSTSPIPRYVLIRF